MMILPRSTRHRRGFVMILALMIAVLLLLAGLAMLTNAQYTASDTFSTEQKNLVFDAADAGLNAAMDGLNKTPGADPSGTQTLPNGYSYTLSGTTNLNGTNPKTNVNDPGANRTITLPAGTALISSTGQSPNAGRQSVVEAIVHVGATNINFPNFTIVAGVDIDGNWNHKIGVAESSPGANDANIHANGNITANAGFVNGNAGATGSVTGAINASSVTNGAPVVNIPNMGPFVAAEKTIAQAGGNNLYIPGSGSLPTTFTCPVSAGPNGCVIFYDGPWQMAGSTTLTYNGTVTVVINGDYKSTGLSSLNFQQGSHSVLVVNGNADIGGNGAAAAYVWSSGDTTLHGNGFDLGAIMAGGSVHFLGGGSGGGLQRDATLAGTIRQLQGKVTIIAYAEY